MSDEKQTFLNKIPIYPLVTIFVIVGGMFVARYQLGELLNDNIEIKKELTELHDDSDIMKIRIVQELYDAKIESLNERHRIELLISSEKIERLESEIESLKK